MPYTARTCRVNAKRAELQAELECADAEERAASLRQWRSRRESSHATGERANKAAYFLKMYRVSKKG